MVSHPPGGEVEAAGWTSLEAWEMSYEEDGDIPKTKGALQGLVCQ